MPKNQNFLINLMEKISFPNESKPVFINLYHNVISNPDYKNQLNLSIEKYMNQDSVEAFQGIDDLAKEMDVHSYTMSMLLLILCAKPLKEQYCKKEIAEDIYWNTMKDLSYKLKECYQIHGIWGTFVRDWYLKFYQMERFTLGRMQYEFSTFMLDNYENNGITVHKGDKILNMHIPSSGSFSKEIRLDSYKKAYSFYKDEFDEKPIPFVCSSWLLYPAYKNVLPKHSNIRSFMDDFSYIYGETSEKFHDAWRIFGKNFDSKQEDLPTDTTLQKVFAKHLKSDGKTGTGYGVFLFDGEKIF